jgi:autotransporter translocation and assembly factor TamB
VSEPTARNLLASQGVTLDANGQAEVEIGGTLASPQLAARGRGRAR